MGETVSEIKIGVLILAEPNRPEVLDGLALPDRGQRVRFPRSAVLGMIMVIERR